MRELGVAVSANDAATLFDNLDLNKDGAPAMINHEIDLLGSQNRRGHIFRVFEWYYVATESTWMCDYQS